MDWWLLLAVFLYFACAVLLIVEVFRPSGGLIGVCAMVCLIGGLMIFFRSSAVAGWVGIVAALIMIPSVLITAFKVFPRNKKVKKEKSQDKP